MQIFQLKMVIFHGYVSLPEGVYIYYYNPSIDDYLYVTNHYYWYYNHY